ncbi:MAG: cobaltochelatase subunit CobN, partial [Pseudomonadales bacterium]|nr:cobaltochelatase subunit CobN [Pseudomonadales bacterium]
MHLLAAQPGEFVDEEGIIDLQQTPGDIVILSAADDTLALLASVAESLSDNYPTVRLANFINLNKPAAFDLYRHQVLDHAKIIILYLLGGESYWQYGLEQLVEWAEENPSRHLIVVPGEDAENRDLMNRSTEEFESVHRVWRYLREGTEHNANQLYRFIGQEYFHQATPWVEPKSLPSVQIYYSGEKNTTLDACRHRWETEQPVALLLFYRNHLQTGNTQVFDEFITCLEKQKLNVLPIAVASLKDSTCVEVINHLANQTKPRIIINTTGFAAQGRHLTDALSLTQTTKPLFSVDVPVLQVMMSSTTKEAWEEHSAGLRPRDIAMHIALPELDGRIITRAVSFKAAKRFSEHCQIDIIQYELHHERAQFVAELAYRWSQLSHKPNNQKRLGLILANYPTRDGRIGNGVGLDTPASTINIIKQLVQAGYSLGEDIPNTGNSLIERLQGSVTNNLDTVDLLPCWQSIDIHTYNKYFLQLPLENQQA